MAIKCTFCSKDSVRGGTVTRFCEYHYGFTRGATNALERIMGLEWQDASAKTRKLLEQDTYYLEVANSR